jgi:hypothetical protein
VEIENAKYREAALALVSFKGPLHVLEYETHRLKSEEESTIGEQQELKDLLTRRTSSENELTIKYAELEAKRLEVKSMQDNLSQNVSLLARWTELFPLSSMFTMQENNEMGALQPSHDDMVVPEAKPLLIPDDEIMLPPDVESTSIGLEEENIAKANMHLAVARQIAQAMSAYILPMLYGLVGACAYILRSLSRDIQKITFTKSSVIEYRLRLPLGMLAGIAVGWFLRPDSEAADLAGIGPLALAFLAGYSVELVFLAMDRLIGAFGADSKRSEKQAFTSRG